MRIAILHPQTSFVRGGAELHTEALTRSLREALDLSAEVEEKGFEDAGTLRFGKIQDHDLETLRRRVAAALTR